jgi:hypothetical protein
MKLALVFSLFLAAFSFAQDNFHYTVGIVPKQIPNLPGIHSYAFGQHEGKWLVIGGRLDGIHARQPFNAFPQSQNNTDVYVIDPVANQFWTASVTSLPTSIEEQLQSTNTNFFQFGDTLAIVGGYGFSVTANDHITYPNLTTLIVSDVVNHVMNSTSIANDFKQISDPVFAVTGGQLAMLNDVFYLVGGHQFDGRYNPMGNATYTQAYTNEIRRFRIQNTGTALTFSDYSVMNDPVHLHRRDYNLMPQIFPNGEEGFLMSAGVFQVGIDLPFLYPIDVMDSSYTPQTAFNQYLSQYHSATAALYDATTQQNHSLYFGGMSQYSYSNGMLVQDNQVPFVKTISRLSRYADNSLHEFQLATEMPGLLGASAEFILAEGIPHASNELILMDQLAGDSILIGYIYGGIKSSAANPFTNNQVNLTVADNNLYEVWLVEDPNAGFTPLNGANNFDFIVSPNPTGKQVNIVFDAKTAKQVSYYVIDANGKYVQSGSFNNLTSGKNKVAFKLSNDLAGQLLTLTLVFDEKFTVSKQLSYTGE